MSRIFTQEELDRMAAQTQDLAKEAIDAGNYQEAKDLIDKMYGELAFLHDGATAWIAGLHTHIYNKYGAKALEEAEREAHTLEMKIALKPANGDDKYRDMRAHIMHTASTLHGHVHQPMTIEEDDEKFIFTVSPCGSGGRLMEMGAYTPEVGFALIKEASPMTYGLTDFPCYCVHCPVTEMLGLEKNGLFRRVHPRTQENVHSSTCQFVFYKDQEDIPEYYFNRVGYEKPEVQDGSMPAPKLKKED